MDRFLKCDMHIHSGSCYSRNYDQSDFIEKIKEVDLDVISITDHNVIDVNLYRDLENACGENKFFIGGIELNLALDDEVIERNDLQVKGDYFHGILWFSTDDIEVFWDRLKNLIIKKFNDDLSQKSLKQISKFSEGKFFYLSEIQEIYKDLNYYLVFHENKSDRNLSDYLVNSVKQNMQYKHKLFYYNNKLAIEGGAKSKVISNYFDDTLQTTISRFFFSDAKKLNEIGKKFTWINFDGKFQSLMLPLSDPESRIFTSDEFDSNPQKNLDNFLDEIKLYMIDPETNSEKEINLKFAPSLNGIIGSRGSGKSLLGSILAGIDTSNYKDYVNMSKTRYKLKNRTFQNSPPKSKYLKQNCLLDIFENGDITKVDFIKNLYNDLESKKKKIIKRFIENANNLLNYEKELFLELDDKYNGSITVPTFIEEEINDEFMIPTIKKDSFFNINNFITNSLASFNNIEQDIDKVFKKVSNLENAPKEYGENHQINNIINTFKQNSSKIFGEYSSLIKSTMNKIKDLDKSKFISRDKAIDKYIELLDEKNDGINITTRYIIEDRSKAIEQLQLLTKFRTQCREIFKQNEKELLKVKEETKSEPLIINKDDEVIISTTIEDMQNYYEIIGSELKDYNHEYHDKKMVEILLSYNDLQRLKQHFMGNRYRNINNKNEYLNKFYYNISNSLQTFEKFKIKLNFNGKDLDQYSPGKKSEILLDMFLDKSILDGDYNYIVLDQPEDNMDTNTITIKLINRIRELKRDIQLFVISHSAAVIINGDSEYITYSYEDEDNGSLNYKQGRIIDEGIKVHIVDTLDGGEKNLKIRFNKYDFNVSEE